MCFPELGCGCFFEECDDGNSAAGDGCDEHCFVERCGNGVRQPSEECDDGNETDGDGCSAACLVEWTCGDGVNEGNEACDDGNTTLNDGCDDRCQVEECGNGVTQSHLGEECDPPNGTTCVADCKLPGRDTCTECVLRASLDIYDLAAYGLDLTTCVGNLILNEWPAGIGGRPDALTCLEDASCVALWNCYARTGCIRGASGIEGTCYCGTGDEWGSTCLSNDNYEATGLCVNEMKAAYTAQYGLPATNTSLLEDFVNPEGAFVGTSSALYLASVAAKSCLEFAEPQRSNDGSIWSFGTLDLGLCLAGVPRSERSECSQACFGDDAGRVLNDDCSALE
jgi:cysteine-rich repeat protein